MVFGFQRGARGLYVPSPGGLPGFQRQRMDQRKKSGAGPTCTVLFGAGTVGGTYSRTAAGYRVPFVDGSVSNAFAYLSTAIKPNTGKWYWEARPITTGNYVLWGLAQNLTPGGYGGYLSVNHGFYNLGSLWSQATVGTTWSLATAAANDVLGFIYDSGAGTFEISLNGLVGGQITGMASVDMYPLMAFQNGGITAGDFIFGSACAYAAGGVKFYGT